MEDPNPVENIDRLGDLMFQTWDKSQLLRRVLWINAQLTNVWHLKHKISQPIYIFNREHFQNSESPNGPGRGLDFIALLKCKSYQQKKTTRKQKERIYLASFFGQKKDPTRQSDLEIDDGAGRISASSLECLY